MKKLFFIIFLMVFSFAISANAKKPKEKVSWPKAVLTLNDGTVLNGYLRTDIYFIDFNFLFSETEDGKSVKYKNDDVKSLVVKDCFEDGKDVTLVPIYIHSANRKTTHPLMAIQAFQGKHVKGYIRPTYFENSTTSRTFTGIMSSSTSYQSGCRQYVYNVDSDSTKNRIFWLYRLVKGKPKYLKSQMKDIKKDFAKYPQFIEIIEKQGITAEQVSDNPIMLLEILDKSLDGKVNCVKQQ